MPGPMQARAREAMRAARTVLLQLVHLPHRANLLVSLSFAPLSPSFSFPGMPPLTGVSIDADQRRTLQSAPCLRSAFLCTRVTRW